MMLSCFVDTLHLVIDAELIDSQKCSVFLICRMRKFHKTHGGIFHVDNDHHNDKIIHDAAAVLISIFLMYLLVINNLAL